MRDLSTSVRRYVAAVCLVAAITRVYATLQEGWRGLPGWQSLGLTVFGVGVLVAEMHPVVLHIPRRAAPEGSMQSFSIGAHAAAAVVFGQLAGRVGQATAGVGVG